jgi:TPR repeat protein
MKWTRLITLSLAALLTFSSVASELDDLKSAAEQGDAEAQYMLGTMYTYTQDDKQAIKWYTKAAEQGYANAQASLSSMYIQGQGVIQSKKKAYIWITIAAANGHEDALKYRDTIAKKLSQKTLEEAQEEASKLYDKISGATD